MAATPLTLAPYGEFGDTVTLVSADETNGNSFWNDGKTVVFLVSNGGAGAHTLTFVGQVASNQGFQTNLQVSIPAGAVRRVVGLFATNRFGSTAQITYDAGSATDLTVAAARLGDQTGQV